MMHKGISILHLVVTTCPLKPKLVFQSLHQLWRIDIMSELCKTGKA